MLVLTRRPGESNDIELATGQLIEVLGLQFNTQGTDIAFSDTEATLTGNWLDGDLP